MAIDIFFFKNHGNERRIKNNHQIVMGPEFDVNGLLKRHWLTSDDFLKTFRWPHDIFMKFHEIFIRPSNLCQKVIRSDTHVPQVSVNIIFRSHNNLMIICG